MDFQDLLQVENSSQESRNLCWCAEGRKVHVRNILVQLKVNQMFGKHVIFSVCPFGDKFPEAWIIFSNKK